MSHTAIMLMAGIALLIGLRFAMRDPGAATRRFLWLWLLISLGNLVVGVVHAGYGLGEEAVVWLLVFGVPAGLALATRKDRPAERSGGKGWWRKVIYGVWRIHLKKKKN